MPPSNRFLKLLRDNAQAKARVPFRAETASGGSVATVYVYDVIVSNADDWFGGVGADDFVKALFALEADPAVDEIHIRFNTPGGDVFAARAMEAAVRTCKKKTVAFVDGFAASAGSYLAISCDEVVIAPGAFFMIHKAWTVGWGNSDELLATAALLEKIDGSLADTYAAETGIAKDEVLAMMAAETWLTGQEAVDKGFADRLMEEAAPKDAAKDWNLSAYANAPARASEPKPSESVVEPETLPASVQDTSEPAAPAFDEAHRRELFARERRLRANRR